MDIIIFKWFGLLYGSGESFANISIYLPVIDPSTAWDLIGAPVSNKPYNFCITQNSYCYKR